MLLVPCCWTGLLRGCKIKGAPKGERKRVLGKREDPGTEENSTPPSNHSSIPLPHPNQNNSQHPLQHPLPKHCRFRVAQDQKAGMLALPSPRGLSIPLYPHSPHRESAHLANSVTPARHFRLLPFPGVALSAETLHPPLKAPNVAPPRAICRPVNHHLCHHLQTPPRPENKASPSRRIPPTTCHPVPAIILPDCCPGLPVLHQPPPTTNPAMSLASATPAPAVPSIPRLSEPLDSDAGDRVTTDSDEKKKKKRSLFSFGKQKEAPPKDTISARRGNTTASPVHTTTSTPHSPAHHSPRLASPAGSQIFERDVQEASTLPTSPAIPSHIQTENYIPPVLDASSSAITSGTLSPDSVSIITHASHQPAAVTSHLEPSASSWADELAAFASSTAATETASNYGSFDTTDVRRLSFISFADVVQAEQHHGGGAGGSRESMGLTSLGAYHHRSPSPMRSPVSSTGGFGGSGGSPPTSKSGSVKGVEMSPVRKPLGSPTGSGLHPGQYGGGLGGPNSPTVSGEISIETMTQALRRTGSGDLSVPRGSVPTSPI